MTRVSRLLGGALSCLTALTVATGFVLPANAQNPDATRAAEWWLTALNVSQAWRTAPGEGKGVLVAVLSTGVDAAHPDLAGDVTVGRDYCGSGRTPASPFWGYEGTAVASLLAGHGHGHGHGQGRGHDPGGTDGITGVAPGARILAVQVTLEYNDPLNSDSAITRRLSAAIASGIRYAVAQGASVIALPLDPGTLGFASADPAAAGGSQAELAAVGYALARNVVLIAPAGDNGETTDSVNYPAAYPGVVAVGATERGGQLASFTSKRPYVALTAPGAGLTVANPDGGYSTLSSTDMSAALTAGVAALIRSRFPRLTAAGVARALEAGTRRTGARPAAGSGHGGLDAALALTAATDLAVARPVPARAPGTVPPPAPVPSPHVSPHHLAARPAGPGALAGSLLRYAVTGTGVLIVALAGVLALTAARRRRTQSARRAGDAPRTRQGGSHARRPRATATGRSHATAQPHRGSQGQPRALGSGMAGTLDGSGTANSTQGPAGAGSGFPRIVPGPVTGLPGASGRAQRRRKPTGNPPWEPASQPVGKLPEHPAMPSAGGTAPRAPGALSRALPAPPVAGRPSAARPAELAPWEESPEEFAAAPVPADLTGRPVNTGPMYMWNPNATTAPQPAIPKDEAKELSLSVGRPLC